MRLSPSDYRPMPWKNGQGITQEIFVQRTDADAANGGFRFRLSLATVQVASPFSRFPHCDRVIVLLDGEGMRLDSGPGRTQRLATRHEPYAFSGDWDTDCTLIGGPCRDFNVMVDRRRAAADVRVIALAAGTTQRPEPQQLTPQPNDELWALFVLDGTVTVCTDAGTTETLSKEHTLIVRGDEEARLAQGLFLRADSADAKLLWVGLHAAQSLNGSAE